MILSESIYDWTVVAKFLQRGGIEIWDKPHMLRQPLTIRRMMSYTSAEKIGCNFTLDNEPLLLI